MRNRLMLLPALVAGLAVTAATAAAAVPARTVARPDARAVVAQAAARTVVLVNGDRLMASAPGTGLRSMAVRPAGPGRGGSLLGLGAGGMRYEIPAVAVPFAGNGLDVSLFNVGELLSRERGGRVPVRVAYRGRRPVLPGVTLTRAGRPSTSPRGTRRWCGRSLSSRATRQMASSGPTANSGRAG